MRKLRYSARIDIESEGRSHKDITCITAVSDGKHYAAFISSCDPFMVELPVDFDGFVEVVFKRMDHLNLVFKITPHPWLGDLGRYLKMLDGEISIPHTDDIYGGASGCSECRKAFFARERYLQLRPGSNL